jgi:bifunctional polynucleotide phosphatase/kinase
MDLDGTLITTRLGGRFPKSAADWKWLRPDIPNQYREICEEYYPIIITNQARIKSADANSLLKDRIQQVYDKLSAISPLQIYAACAKDKWRKPHTTIYEEYIVPQMGDQNEIIFIGDAAGRPNDIGDSDRALAYNLGLVSPVKPLFATPEEYFWEEAAQPRTWNRPNPRQWLDVPTAPIRDQLITSIPVNIGCILLVGAPGSGKSTLARALSTHSHFTTRTTLIINQDTLKTKARCFSALNSSLQSHHLAIIDETAPSLTVRQKYYEIMLSQSAPCICICIHFDRDSDLLDHLRLYRQRINDVSLPDIAYRIFNKNLVKPKASEWKNYPERVIEWPWMPNVAEANRKYFLQRL